MPSAGHVVQPQLARFVLAKLVSALTVNERRRSSASRNSSLALQTMIWIFRRCEQFLLQRRSCEQFLLQRRSCSRNDSPRRRPHCRYQLCRCLICHCPVCRCLICHCPVCRCLVYLYQQIRRSLMLPDPADSRSRGKWSRRKWSRRKWSRCNYNNRPHCHLNTRRCHRPCSRRPRSKLLHKKGSEFSHGVRWQK